MRSTRSAIFPALLACAAVLFVVACAPSGPAQPQPPVAKIVPHELEKHGDVRVDDYYWLKERDNPEVTAYLTAENTYLDAVMQHTEPLREKLYEEIVGRIKEDDDTVPYKRDDYYYYARYVEGGEYPVFCRKQGSLEAGEEVMLDGNALAAGHEAQGGAEDAAEGTAGHEPGGDDDAALTDGGAAFPARTVGLAAQEVGQEPADERADDAEDNVPDDAQALVTLDEETGQVPGDGAEDDPRDDAH